MKILPAKLSQGKVYVNNSLIQDTDILSQALKDSTGYVLIDGPKYFYLTKTTQDLADTLNIVVDLSKTLINLCEKLTAAITPGTPASVAATFPADVSSVRLLVLEVSKKLEAIKNNQY
jgi:hypothetical protein